jgi:hypothetical protein
MRVAPVALVATSPHDAADLGATAFPDRWVDRLEAAESIRRLAGRLSSRLTSRS